MKILFVCKYNRFRSKIAEAYFNKISKNVKVASAGLIKGFLPLDKDQVKTARRFNINIIGKPKTLSMDLLKKQDKIIVIADDIPRSIFNYKWYRDKIVIWKIRDVDRGSDIKGNEFIIKSIIKKVDQLNKELKRY